MLPFLRGQKLYGFVDGNTPCPPSSDTAAYDKWQQQDNNLMSLLVGSLSHNVIPTVHHATTSKEIWDTHTTTYASPSHTRILSLHLALQNIEHKPDETITQFLHRARHIHDELAATGWPLSPEDFNLYIFKGLREDFRVMIPTLTTRLDSITYSELHSLLLSHEFMTNTAIPKISAGDVSSANLVEQNSTNPSSEQAYSSRGRGSRGRGRVRGGRWGSRGRRLGNQWCSYCQRSNHANATCYYKDQHSQPSHFYAPNRDHYYNQPPYRGPTPYGSPSQVHLLTNYPNTQPSPFIDWHPGISATSHVTPDLQSLPQYESYGGYDQLHVGDGTPLPIKHVDKFSNPTTSYNLNMSNVLHVPAISKSLLSVQQFCHDNNVFFKFYRSHFVVKDQDTKNIILSGPPKVVFMFFHRVSIIQSISQVKHHLSYGIPDWYIPTLPSSVTSFLSIIYHALQLL
ncbi:UBN2 domain-containing protein [Cephalotus follicularis]|uniref:UBN2 domain-containing protein n=1 Tax=Cephalotus follicularis TaxID=3775 RepID=A0A1Q3BCL4_CEPFO|nr:UBN2 domain-containing protein [Cephalotus follicularis]